MLAALILVIAGAYITGAFAVARAAERRGRSFAAFWVIGLFALPLAFLIVACMREEPLLGHQPVKHYNR